MLLGFISPMLNLVILLGMLQGFIFSILLFGSVRRRPAR
jgi:hypothetical protein